MAGYITHIDEVEPVLVDGDTSARKTTIDRTTGAENLEQSVVRYTTGESLPRNSPNRDEIAYVVSGSGSLIVDGETHSLHPDLGVYVRAGETSQVVNSEIDDLVLVSVTAPLPDDEDDKSMRKFTVNVADQPVIPAGKDREFKFVVDPEAGCREVTQFVGWIPPGRAPTHYHLYDEVMYILDGDGLLHLEGHPDTMISTGSCIHLPPPVEHCVENTGDRPLRVLGVFHPAGSAAEAYEDTNNNEGNH